MGVETEAAGEWQLQREKVGGSACDQTSVFEDVGEARPVTSERTELSLIPRVYRVVAVLRDSVGNTARFTSRSVRVLGEALPRPDIARANATTLAWSSTPAFDLQWSFDEFFQRGVTTLRRVRPLVLAPSPRRLADAVVFVRISSPTRRAGAFPSRSWTTTEVCADNSCGVEQFLDEDGDDPYGWACEGARRRRRRHGGGGRGQARLRAHRRRVVPALRHDEGEHWFHQRHH